MCLIQAWVKTLIMHYIKKNTKEKIIYIYIAYITFHPVSNISVTRIVIKTSTSNILTCLWCETLTVPLPVWRGSRRSWHTHRVSCCCWARREVTCLSWKCQASESWRRTTSAWRLYRTGQTSLQNTKRPEGCFIKDAKKAGIKVQNLEIT